MSVFVDTSAFLAVLDANDANHAAARERWAEMLTRGEDLITHNYVLVEASAVIARKLGVEATRVFEHDVVPVVRTIWVSREIHAAGVGAQLAAARRSLSLVDCVSLEIMRRTGVLAAFTFDKHFAEQGYETIPPRL